MKDEMREQLEKLMRSVGELERTSRTALGFEKVIEYMGITFHVTRRFVLADTAPLAFSQLVEPIGPEGAGPAVVRLYDRLAPLLTCRHQWSPLRRTSDRYLQRRIHGRATNGLRSHVCKCCTAYALSAPNLPRVGRTT